MSVPWTTTMSRPTEGIAIRPIPSPLLDLAVEDVGEPGDPLLEVLRPGDGLRSSGDGNSRSRSASELSALPCWIDP